MSLNQPDSGQISVCVAQPALPAYRVPVFRALADRPGVRLRVVYGNERGAPTNAKPVGFDGGFAPLRGLASPNVVWFPRQAMASMLRDTDVLVLPWNIRYLDLVPALLRARSHRIATVLWGHGYSKDDDWLRTLMRDEVGDLATAVLFYSHRRATKFLERRGGSPDRVHVAPNALDQTPIQAARDHWLRQPEALHAFRMRHGLHGRKVIMFVSRLMRQNRVDTLILALAELRIRLPEAMLVVVGSGDDRDHLAALTDRSGLKGHVLFAGPEYDENRLAPWFLSAHAFCYPENAGLSLLHAFGYGLPVVLSDRVNAHNPEVETVRPRENGLFYRHGDVHHLADTLHRLLTDDALACRMSAGARKTVAEHYSLRSMVDGLEGVIQYAADRVKRTASAGVGARELRGAPSEAGAKLEDTPIKARDPIDVAVIANAHAPYRAHLHLRIVREMPAVRLWSLYTHEFSNAPWAFNVPAELRPMLFGKGERAERQSAPANALREWRKGGRIIRFLRQQNVRAIVMLGYNDTGRLRIIRWCGRHGIPCFLWGDSNIRGDAAAGLKLGIKRRLLNWVFRRCAGVLPCGRLGVEYFAKYGADPRRMFLFPLEPDYDLPGRLSPAAVERVRSAAGIPREGRKIVFSGRLVPAKRCDLLIDAFVAVAARRPEWSLVVVGDGPLRAELQERVPAELRPRVLWTGFFADQEDVAAVYRLADLLVLPSDFEPWALVTNEAVGAGLAVVASDAVGAAPELVHDGVNGRLFPAGDLAALTDALLQVTDPVEIDRLKAGSAQVLAEWRAKADPVKGLNEALRSAGLGV